MSKQLLCVVSLLLTVAANAKLLKNDHASIITDSIASFSAGERKLGQDICDGQTCCNVTSTNLCPLASMSKGQSTLVLPGGETRCIYSYSTPFAFQVFPGDSDKVLIYFQGGGACWDEQSTKDGFCTTDAVPQKPLGVFNKDNELNKFKSYTIVHVMYCSGDLFGGNVVRDYNDANGQPIKQTGLANAHSALNWVVEQTQNGGLASTLSDVVVMGCSAGSLGTQFWAKEILNTLKWKQAAIVPDSYAGVFPLGSVGPLVHDFGFCTSGFLSDDLYAKCMSETLSIEEINLEFAAAHPTVPVAFLQSKVDSVQQAYYIALGLSMNSTHSETTPTQFYADTNTVFGLYNDKLKNFLTYLVDGEQHCFTCIDLFFTADAKGANDNGATTAGLTMSQWVGSMPLSSASSSNTVCEGANRASLSAETGLVDNTYCSSKVFPKEFVENY